VLEPLIGDAVETAAIASQWTELMRLKPAIEADSVIPSVILHKLSAAGTGNAVSRALRALGRIERTLFSLQWLSDPDLRQRSHAGLNKGQASNALRRTSSPRVRTPIGSAAPRRSARAANRDGKDRETTLTC
jgi:TnpA family transposase